MSTAAFEKSTPEIYQSLYPRSSAHLPKWWEIWKKYHKDFQSDQFLLFAEDSEEWFQIYLVNTEGAIRKIKENHSLFQERLGLNLSPEELFCYIFSCDDLFTQGLGSSQALYGLLLGYGRENALSFERFYCGRGSSSPLDFDDEEDEVSLALPGFAAFSEVETRALMEGYKADRSMIIKLLTKDNLLETSLKRLSE